MSKCSWASWDNRKAKLGLETARRRAKSGPMGSCPHKLWACSLGWHGIWPMANGHNYKKKCYYFSKKTKRKCYCIREILLFFFVTYTPRTTHVFLKTSLCTKRSHNTSTRTLPTPRLWMCTAQHSKGQARTDDTPRRLVRGCLEARASAVRIPLDLRFCAFTVHT